jgi:hypothetical protein
VKPFRIKLKNDANRGWEVIDDKTTTEDEIVALFKKGNTATYIKERLGISSARVSQAKADAIERGELNEDDVKTEKPGRKLKIPLTRPVEKSLDESPIEKVVEEPIEKPLTTPEEEVEHEEAEFVEVPSRSELEKMPE